MENLIGKKIIDFTLHAYCKGQFTTVSSKSLLGNWAGLMFYPADFTFVCPTDLADLGKLYPEFQEIGCRVFSVSTDSEFVHKAWADASATIGSLPYEMIADKAGVFASSSPMVSLKHTRYLITASAAMPQNCYARCRLLSLPLRTAIRYALPNGIPVKRRSILLLT